MTAIKHQVLRITGTINSSCQQISIGVAQGSVLGPLPFLLYSNEIGTLTSGIFFDVC